MSKIEKFESWDPLDATAGADPGLIISAQRREISNILRSYTGYYDVFSELLQNALDAVERRSLEIGEDSPVGNVWILIDIANQIIEVTDDGCAMDINQMRQFLRPNFSFKSGVISRGSKGVGATYLGYGFNFLHISSKLADHTYSGKIENGRIWVDDSTGTVGRPMIVNNSPHTGIFESIERGTSITVMLKGDNVRPKDLGWYQATTADQWLSLLRIMTPVGGIYLDGEVSPAIQIHVTVRDGDGHETKASTPSPEYLYPHLVVSRSASIIEFLKDQEARRKKGQNFLKPPPKFSSLNGLWGSWATAALIDSKPEDFCPIRLSLDKDERELAIRAGVSIYVYLAYSTELWDVLNDRTLRLRKTQRVLHGGIQLATRHMPQGITLTIPMTNNIGFQNLVHILVHFRNAEPDLGRKGFQPEFVKLAEKIAVSATTAFRRRHDLLRKPGAAKIFNDELKIEQWIRDQEQHEINHALTINGAGLFLPTETLPIRSEPLVEQDVVALFNQMLSSGLVRGIQLIASSQYNQYDGLYRVRMDPPFDKFIRSNENPLGIDADRFDDDQTKITKVKVLEYKFNLDGLVEELQGEIKDINDIGLVVAWEMGTKWREMFDVTCLIDDDSVHHRQIHGTTHSFTHSTSGVHAFEAIILHDLVRYLKSPIEEIMRQRALLALDE